MVGVFIYSKYVDTPTQVIVPRINKEVQELNSLPIQHQLTVQWKQLDLPEEAKPEAVSYRSKHVQKNYTTYCFRDPTDKCMDAAVLHTSLSFMATKNVHIAFVHHALSMCLLTF